MQLTANTQALLEGLNIVTRALSPRPAKQILEGVLLAADDEGIMLSCSDSTLSIETYVPGTISELGRTVMPGRLFSDLTRKLPNADATIRVGHERVASIRCGSSRSSMSTMNAMEFPDMATIEDGISIRIPQNRLREMINRVTFSVATDESRQILTGCLLEVTADEARLIALDGFRLALQRYNAPFTLPEGTAKLRIIIPGRILNEIAKILPDTEDECLLTFDRTHMEASFGSTRVSSVLLAGEYIDYTKILPAAFKTTASVDRTLMQNAIDRASLMAREGKNNLIRFKFTADNVNISSNAEMGDTSEDVPCELTGDPIEIAFNAKYLTDIIRSVGGDTLNMNFNSSVSPCVIAPSEGNDYTYLLLPVRIFS